MLLIPPADLDVPGLGAVKAGQPIEVPDELAGRAPDPRRDIAMAEHAAAVAALDHHRAAALRDEIVGLDMGVGLLAQGWSTVAPLNKPAKPARDQKETDPA